MIQNILAQLTISLYSNKSTCLTWGELSSLHRKSSHSPINKHQEGRWCDTAAHHVVITCFSNEDCSKKMKSGRDQPVSQLCFSLHYSPFVYSTLVSHLFSFLLASYRVFSSRFVPSWQTMSCTSSLSLSSQPSSFFSHYLYTATPGLKPIISFFTNLLASTWFTKTFLILEQLYEKQHQLRPGSN